jgi:murein DD-endopeptidase MepM/ murein hydrolase activator NlpD
VRRRRQRSVWWAPVLALLLCGTSAAQSAYKYKDANGNWVYTDKAPAATAAHDDSINLGRQNESLHLDIERSDQGTTTTLTAVNDCICIASFTARIVHSKDPTITDGAMFRKVLQPRTRELLVSIDNAGQDAANLEYQWLIALGPPDAQHKPSRPYRAPFAVGSTFVVSQAYPEQYTHVTPDSQYAVDIALPDGSQVYAAREGTVINVRHDAFRGGLSPALLDQANVIEILHDDGTIALYAHLHWDSIRVHIGQHVERGQYIANSGSTGFSSGPHLHFCVVRNAGVEAVSVPVEFAGPADIAVTPETHKPLTAY